MTTDAKAPDAVDADALREAVLAEERERIVTIRSQAFTGQDELVDELISSGASVEDSLSRIIADQKTRGGNALAAMEANAPAPVGSDDGELIVEDSKKDGAEAADANDPRSRWDALTDQKRADYGSFERFEWFLENPEFDEEG